MIQICISRVVASVKRLKELNVATRAKGVKASEESNQPDEEPSTTVTAIANSIKKDEMENEALQKDFNQKEQENESEELSMVQEVNESAELVDGNNEQSNINSKSMIDVTEVKDELYDQSVGFVVTDDEARVWRRRFVAACR